MSTAVCVPGDRLGLIDQFEPGHGTHVRNGVIYASLCGTVAQQQQKDASEEPSTSGRPILEVICPSSSALVPMPGAIVTVKVTRVTMTSASCNILCVGSRALTQEFKGIIRQQDVRATEIDKVVMVDCFRPGDVVRAEVLSLGDARSFYLTTAQNDLGVVYAKSVSGNPMVAISWSEMQDPETLATEKRKVAKTEVPDKMQG